LFFDTCATFRDYSEGTSDDLPEFPSTFLKDDDDGASVPAFDDGTL
jgi:hypothetical protein